MNERQRAAPGARHNQLLAAPPEAEWGRWQGPLERVHLARGKLLCEAGSAPEFACFPTTAIASLVNVTEDGCSAEVAVVGHEGGVGISTFMGGLRMPGRAVVQSARQGHRLRAQFVRNEALHAGPALAVLLRHTRSLIGQIVMTQELASSLLGVRREGVTAAAGKLRQAGVIRYSRGRIAALDRGRLEQRTCEFHVGAKRPGSLPLIAVL